MNAVVSGVGVEAIEYHRDAGTVRTLFDHEKTPASIAVTATLADMMDTDPVELDPLYSTVDPDSLDALLRVRPGTDGDIHVTFTHEDHTITVSSYGTVTITAEYDSTAAKNEREAGI